MALPDEIKDLESIDEALREHYRKVGDVHVLDIQSVGGRTLEDVTGLRTTLEKERESRKTFESKARSADDAVAKANERIAAVEAKAKKAAGSDDERAAQWQKERQELIDQHTATLSEREKQLATLTKEGDDAFRAQEVDKAIAEYEKKTGRRPSKRGITLLFEKEGVVERDANDQRVLKIRDPDDNRVLLSKENHGAEMQALERIQEMGADPDLAGFFPGTGAHGSGADGRSTAGGSSTDGLPTGTVSAEDAGMALEDIAAGKVTIGD